MARSEFGRAVRSARMERGITQSRLAAALGIPVVRLAGWEHGDAVPGSAELDALAGELGLDRDDIIRLAGLRAPRRTDLSPAPADPAEPERTIAVEILSAARHTEDPWDLAPEGHNGDDRRASARRRRRMRSDARDRHRAQVARLRDAERAGDEARRATIRTGPGATAPPVFAPDVIEERSHIKATVNRGSVFPIPASRLTVDTYTYGTAEPTYRGTPEDRMVYRSRWMRVVLVLVALLALLGWAWAQLGDGWDAVIDLFRDEEPTTTVAALRVWWGI